MQQKEKEGEMLLASLTPSDTVILLDEKGREYTSREFADFQASMMNRGVKRLVYVIGALTASRRKYMTGLTVRFLFPE